MAPNFWTVVGILIGATLGLLALGFAAMSTNPPFTVQPWVPILFFILAGLTFLALVVYLLFPKVKGWFKRINLPAELSGEAIEAAFLKNKRLAAIEKKRQNPLQIIRIHREPPDYIENLLLEIKNTSDSPISGVYGKYISAQSTKDGRGSYGSAAPMVPLQSKLLWKGGGFLKILPVNSPCDLNIARGDPPQIYFDVEQGTADTHLLGAWILDLEIGSESNSFPPANIKIKLYRGYFGGALEGKLVKSE